MCFIIMIKDLFNFDATSMMVMLFIKYRILLPIGFLHILMLDWNVELIKSIYN